MPSDRFASIFIEFPDHGVACVFSSNKSSGRHGVWPFASNGLVDFRPRFVAVLEEKIHYAVMGFFAVRNVAVRYVVTNGRA